jgi:hypothetical protein
MAITRKIGEVFTITNPYYPYNTVCLKVKLGSRCDECFFYKHSLYNTCNKPLKGTGFCSASCRSDNREAIFVQVANSVPEDKTTISQPSCVFCREVKELKYDLSRGISTICSVQGHLPDEFTIHWRYYFKYCPICGKKL